MNSNVLEFKGNRRLAWLLFIWLNLASLGICSSFYLYDMTFSINKIDYFWLISSVFCTVFLVSISKFICSSQGDSVTIQNKEIELHRWYGRKTNYQINEHFELNTEFKYKIFFFFNVNMDTSYSGLLQLKQESNEPIYIPIDSKNIESEIQRIKDILAD